MKKSLSLKKTVIIIILGICSIAFVRQQFSMHRIKKEIEQSKKELSELQKQNAMLEAELDSAKNNTDEYLEKLARERLGMIKPGEQVVSFSNDQETEKSSD